MSITSIGVLFVVVGYGLAGWANHWEFSDQGIREIRVQGKAAKVQLTQVEGALLRVSVSGKNESAWHQELQNGVLKVEGASDAGSVEGSSLMIEIPKGAISSSVVLEEGNIDLKGVSRVAVNLLKGKIVASQTGEGMRYFMQKGEVQSRQQSGALEIESYGGKIMLSEGQGPVKIRLFNGEIAMAKNMGSLSLDSFSSSAKIDAQQGAVSLHWGKGALSFADFSGRVEGVSEDGQIQIQTKSEAMVDLQAMRGRVQIHLPKDSGATLNVRSSGGEVSLPSSIKLAREGKVRVARGKLGGAIKGSINIRTEEASIGIR